MTDKNKGPVYAILAFVLWGLTPIYFKALASASAIEIIAHRVVWSVLIIATILLVIRRYSGILKVFRAPQLLGVLMASGVLVGFNWVLYVWSVNNGYILQASLGYYINPLFNIVLGVLILKERHGWWQWLAVALATIGVLNMVILGGEVPWIALGLACSFGAYGVIRKIVPVGALDGLFVETLLFSPFALGYLMWLGFTHTGQFATSWEMTALLIVSGAVTTIPLLSFAAAAKRLHLSTLGFLQFITPTLHFSLGVFLYGEILTPTHIVTFSFIWIALGVYCWAGMKRQSSTENA